MCVHVCVICEISHTTNCKFLTFAFGKGHSYMQLYEKNKFLQILYNSRKVIDNTYIYIHTYMSIYI